MSVQGGYSFPINALFWQFMLLCGTSFGLRQDNVSAPLLSPEQAFAFSVESTKTIKRVYTGPFSQLLSLSTQI